MGSMAAKRVLDFDVCRQTDPLIQSSAKRRVTEVTPILPQPFVFPTGFTASCAGTIPSEYKGKEKGDTSIERTKQNADAFRSHKLDGHNSPESVYSERTENMFVSASDQDSDSSS